MSPLLLQQVFREVFMSPAGFPQPLSWLRTFFSGGFKLPSSIVAFQLGF